MNSYSRRARRFGRTPSVTRDDINRFLTLSDEQQFDDLVELRTSAAHLDGGSFGAFTAIYLTVVLGAVTILSSGLAGLIGPVSASMSMGAVILFGGLLIAVGLTKQQRDLAREAVLLQFYEEMRRREAQ